MKNFVGDYNDNVKILLNIWYFYFIQLLFLSIDFIKNKYKWVNKLKIINHDFLFLLNCFV